MDFKYDYHNSNWTVKLIKELSNQSTTHLQVKHSLLNILVKPNVNIDSIALLNYNQISSYQGSKVPKGQSSAQM